MPHAAGNPACRAILCIHGGGSSPDIFRFQTSRIRATMKGEFVFFFATAPHPSEAGPEVLPFFAGMEPYLAWFRYVDNNVRLCVEKDETLAVSESVQQEISTFNDSIKEAVDQLKANSPSIEVVGVLGFSQGAIAATILLWEQQAGLVPWLPRLKTAVLICSGYREIMTQYMRDFCATKRLDENEIVIKIPTLHLGGRKDVYGYPQTWQMFTTHFSSQSSEFHEFEGGHELPKSLEDIQFVTRYFKKHLDESKI
ncbi:oxidoreductase [Colletotrichum graminicola]|uniref:Oxidoreductase n=1 Tax=Colletotrichum graminicola (strain M1.001 / M2 / FGSC 10212) TaxID=645133 RepID=E3R0V4_COLGM|nr:oxidoreductase [Colletotrichum graminicola M1.001]EFQ36742.1 oxidoreductase [Colletotrichum graminicola M1.001]WDK15629.1 oxidoreductase [Colletotrichum graminicola]